jgi:transmembrane sensor
MKPAADSDEYWEALGRFAAGESTPEERSDVERALEADPAVAALLAPIDRLDATTTTVNVEAALRRVHERLDEADVIALPSRQERPLVGRSITPWRAAAAIAVLVGGSALWLTTRDGAAPEGPALAQTFQTGIGETDSIRLADNTLVVLGPSSRLVVAAKYGRPDRSVDLEGVALFDVLHDERHEFSVHAGGAEIRDVGTSFTVRTEADGGVSVSVTEGSVLINDRIALNAGEAATIDASGVAQAATPVADAIAWTRGKLVFDNAPFSTVSDDLKRWFGIVLIAGDSAMSDRRLTSTFEGESVDEILTIISLALDARLEMRGDTAVLHTAR